MDAKKPFLVVSHNDILAKCSSWESGKNTLAQMKAKFPDLHLYLCRQDCIKIQVSNAFSLPPTQKRPQKEGNFFLYSIKDNEILLEGNYPECLKLQEEGQDIISIQDAEVEFVFIGDEPKLFIKKFKNIQENT